MADCVCAEESPCQYHSSLAWTIPQLEARALAAERERDDWKRRAEAAEALFNTSDVISFADAVVREAAHQSDRWGDEHDAQKIEADWYWIVCYLARNALHEPEKRLHHIITTAAVCANWHAAESRRANGGSSGLVHCSYCITGTDCRCSCHAPVTGPNGGG